MLITKAFMVSLILLSVLTMIESSHTSLFPMYTLLLKNFILLGCGSRAEKWKEVIFVSFWILAMFSSFTPQPAIMSIFPADSSFNRRNRGIPCAAGKYPVKTEL